MCSYYLITIQVHVKITVLKIHIFSDCFEKKITKKTVVKALEKVLGQFLNQVLCQMFKLTFWKFINSVTVLKSKITKNSPERPTMMWKMYSYW